MQTAATPSCEEEKDATKSQSIYRRNDPVDTQIDFYLKLNRFGCQIVECPTVPASCWRVLLSRMTTNKVDVDVAALFHLYANISQTTNNVTRPISNCNNRRVIVKGKRSSPVNELVWSNRCNRKLIRILT
jgi:hypothetical protein